MTIQSKSDPDRTDLSAGHHAKSGQPGIDLIIKKVPASSCKMWALILSEKADGGS
jgi:hypothetical protein